MNPSRNSNHTAAQVCDHSPEPIRFAGTTLDEHCHIYAFFNSAVEEGRALLPFIKEGLEAGEKAFHVVDPILRDAHLEHLHSAGIEAGKAEQSGQLELRNWNEAYLRDGHFDQDRMLALLQGVLDEARQQGFTRTRLVAHMEWALEDRPGVNDIVEYETRLNYFLHRYRDPVICVYDLAKFGADTVIDIMRTHPTILIGGVLQQNPFFIPPDQFLLELRDRQGMH